MAARILVMGTGGVGGYFGAALAQEGHDVTFVARGPNLDALRSTGLRVTGARGEITLPEVRATDGPATAGPQDLVLMCVKAYDLAEAARACAAGGGIVLTLQNGVEAARIVNDAQGRDAALAGTTGIVADLTEPGHVHVVSSYARIRFGEPAGEWSERTERVAGWLQAARGIDAEAVADVRPALWDKMAIICPLAGLTTLLQIPIGAIRSDPHGRATLRRIIEEVEAVAEAEGVELRQSFVEDRLTYLDGIDPTATASMARDLRRGKPIELDTITGAVVRLGEKHDIAVPVDEAIYAGISLLVAERDA